MSCRRCRERLSDFVGGACAPSVARAVREHLAGCIACDRRSQALAATLSLLHRAGEESLPSDFATTLRRKLMTEPSPSPLGLFDRLRAFAGDHFVARPIVGAGALAALSAAAFLGVPALRVRSHDAAPLAVKAGDVAPIFVVPKARIAVVRIDFVADQDIDDVAFAIRLPEGLHFVSEGRELPDREFRWQGRLARGSNPIPVAVRGARAGRYTLLAHAVGLDLDAMQSVVLEVTSG